MWKENVQNRLDEIVEELGLPKDSLMLETNMSKDGKRVTSYSICIFEPDYPPTPGEKTKNAIVLNIKPDESRSNSGLLEFLVNNEQIKNVGIPQGAETKVLKSDNMVKHVLLHKNDNSVIEFAEDNVRYCLEHYTSKNGTFGCCGKFRECSKAGKCLHENLLYAKGCQYRPNMEKGNAYMIDAWGEYMDYTVFDVETANVKRESICSIGIIRCEDGHIVYEKELLINPETHFDYYNTRIHGITEDMVKDAPTFSEIWPDIKEYFSNTVLVAHNAKSMDLCALYKTIDRYDLPEVHNEYICTYELSRQLLSEQLSSFKLNVLCNYYGISLDNHHNALCDTKACYEILLKLKEEFGNSIYPQPYYYNKRNNCEIRIEYKGLGERYSSKTKDMQELQDIVAGIIDDNRISVDEIDSLNIWLDKHEYLLGYYPFDKIYNTVENILEDGVMDENEEVELLKLLDRFVNPETSNENVTLEGKKVCLSGEFDFGSKKDVEAYVTSKGGEIVNSVTKKTDILIMGEAGSAAWKYGNYGSKYEKARQLKEKGSDIIVVKERDVIES